MKQVFSSIDIGSDTVKIIVCELVGNKLNLLAASSVPSRGIKRGLIIDMEEARLSVKKAFEEIEQMLGVPVRQVIASVPSDFAEFTMIRGDLDISDKEVITGEEIGKVFGIAARPYLVPTKELVTILPIEFAVDGRIGLKDPKGLQGTTLTTKAVLVTTPKKNIYSVVNLLDSIGIEVIDISLNSIGDLYAFKNKEIDSKVGSIINIGAETTTVSLYNRGIIVKSSVLPFGSRNIDNELMYQYKLDERTSRKIKERFALANKRYASTGDVFDLPQIKFKISQFEVSEFIQERLVDILVHAKKEIHVLTNKDLDYVIVSGGMSNMEHFNYTLEEVFDKNISIGNVKLIGIRNNKYSSCIGNIIYFINKLKLKGKKYSMVSQSESEELASTNSKIINVSNETMLGKVFGYFFGE